MFTKYDEICPFQRLHKTCTISSPKYVVFLPSAFFIVHLVVSSALFLSPKDEAISSGHIVLFLLYLGLCSSKFFWSVNLSSRDKVICANSRYIDVLFPHPTVEYSLFALNTTFSDARQHLANNQVATPPSAITNLPSLTTNASFSTEPFSYIIPYNESQECDIFGPLCQTGLVTVGVSLASSTTTTTIPCSSYLSAQAAYLLSARLESGGYITLQEPREWLTAFGRSPECKSYAGVHRNGEQYTFSDCGSKNTIIQASEGFSLPTQIPPGVVDRFRPLDYACCGNCTLIVPEVRLLYFPDQAAPQCENPSSNSSAIVSARPNNKRVQPLNNTGTTAIFSGHTLTSPSVYLQVVGTAAMRDECGSLGPILTNSIITLLPDVLSTYVPPYYSIGSIYTDPNVNDGYFAGHKEPLTIADLQCPTFGLGIKTSADGSLYTTVGPPWLPIIIPPPEVFTLDPTWESICTDLASYYVFMSFAIFDPPFALAPESYLVAPSPAASSLKLEGPPPVPANPTAKFDPQATYTPDLSGPPSSPLESVTPPVGDSLAPHDPPANAAQPAAVPFDPSARPTSVPDPSSKSPPKPQGGDSTHSLSSGLGSFIFGAVGKSNPRTSGSGSADLTHIIPVPESGIEQVTVGGQILSISPSGLYLSRTSYSPGGPAITLSDGVISLVSASAEEAANPDGGPPTNSQPSTPNVETIAGQDVISNTSGVYVAGSRLSPGGSAITASDTIISLSPAGTLVVGSSSIALSLVNTQVTSPTHFSLDGVDVQAEPSAAVVDGVTLTPGRPGNVIYGSSISLEQGGTLNIGNGRFALPNVQKTTPSAFTLDGMTVRLESSAVLIDGITLTTGGSGVSIHGNFVSLEQNRILDIGTSKFALPPAAQETPPNRFNLNGMTVQAQQSTVAVNGITLTPGRPGTTINGSSVSLESDGILDIGTDRFAIPTGPVNGKSLLQTFEGAQEKGHRLPRSLIFAALTVSGLRTLVS